MCARTARAWATHIDRHTHTHTGTAWVNEQNDGGLATSATGKQERHTQSTRTHPCGLVYTHTHTHTQRMHSYCYRSDMGRPCTSACACAAVASVRKDCEGHCRVCVCVCVCVCTQLVDKVVQSCPIDYRRRLYSSVALCGGTACMRHLPRRLEVRVCLLGPLDT